MKKSTQKTRVPANLNLQTTARKEGRCLSVLVPLLAALTLAVSASQVRAQITGAEYNLKLDFGAVGDGNANDSPALQAALDAMAQAGGGRSSSRRAVTRWPRRSGGTSSTRHHPSR
jgi:hypothetical protein